MFMVLSAVLHPWFLNIHQHADEQAPCQLFKRQENAEEYGRWMFISVAAGRGLGQCGKRLPLAPGEILPLNLSSRSSSGTFCGSLCIFCY